MKKLTMLFSILCLTLALTVPASALDCVSASSISLTPPQAAGFAHSVAPPLLTQTLRVCAGSPFFPVLKVGNRLVVPKEKFVEWVSQRTRGGAE